MTKAKAVKEIYKYLQSRIGGLPRAIEIYNYLSCNGEIEVTEQEIAIFFFEGKDEEV